MCNLIYYLFIEFLVMDYINQIFSGLIINDPILIYLYMK